MKTFEEWLITHKNRKSPLGDLANDYIRTKKIYPQYSSDTVEQSMTRAGACREAWEAYKNAQKSYKAFLKRQQTKDTN